MKYFVTGGAGFIGAHIVNYIIDHTDSTVTVYDNFSNGRSYAFGPRQENPRLNIIKGDANNLSSLCEAISDHDVVYHLASNADISKAVTNPEIDFLNGTYLTHNTLEAMRLNGVKRIFFTSGSGVYGDVPPEPIPENYDKMIPISTYGACKLSSEALISAYSYMFGMVGTVVRFANVVGPHPTHGVLYDFIRRLSYDSAHLKIFGNGQQRKPYIHIDDIISALCLLEKKQTESYDVFNVGNDDCLTVKEIADIITKIMELKNVNYNFTGGSRGWKADVPVYSLDSSKIKKLGWNTEKNSRQAVEAATKSILEDIEAGNIVPCP